MTQYQPPSSAPEIAPTDPQEIIRDMYSSDKQNDYSMPMTQFGGFGHGSSPRSSKTSSQI